MDKSASSFCNLCSYSKYSSGSATSCETCAANQNTTSNAKQSRSECRDYCGVGQVGYNGVQPCFPCLSGSFTSKLGTKCLVNENASISYWNVSGLVSGKGNGSCQLYFANDSEVLAAFGCVNCRAGYYQNMTGQSSCDICSFNVYAGGGATSCTPCPTGAVTLNKGSQSQSDCVLSCKSGYYSLNGQQPCSICYPGKYSKFENNRNFGSTACSFCPKGTFMPRYGASFCYFCPTGQSTLTSGAINVSNCHGNVAKTVCLSESHESVQVAPIYTVFNANSSAEGYFDSRDVSGTRTPEISILDSGSGYIDGALGVFSYGKLVANGSFYAQEGRIVSATLESAPDMYAGELTVHLFYSHTSKNMTGTITAIQLNSSQVFGSCSEGSILMIKEQSSNEIRVANFTCNKTICNSNILEHVQAMADPPMYRVISGSVADCRCGSGLESIDFFEVKDALDVNISLIDNLGKQPMNGTAHSLCNENECENNFKGVCVYNGSEIVRIDVLYAGEGFLETNLPTIECSFLDISSSASPIHIRILKAAIGRSLVEYGSHEGCARIEVAQKAELVISPLYTLQRSFTCNKTYNQDCTIVLNQVTLDNDRLYSFLMLSTGLSEINIGNFECRNVKGIQLSNEADNIDRTLTNSLYCIGEAVLWGSNTNLSILFLETVLVKETPSLSGIQMHMALFIHKRQDPAVWTQLMQNLPVLEGAEYSWLNYINTAAPHGHVNNVSFQSSTIGFSIGSNSSLQMSLGVPSDFSRGILIGLDGQGLLAEDQHLYSHDLSLESIPDIVYLNLNDSEYRIDLNQTIVLNKGSFRFLGLERMLPKVKLCRTLVRGHSCMCRHS